MQTTRLYLTTDDDGRILGLPPLPPNAHLEAILLVIEAPQAGSTKRKPSARIAGLGDKEHRHATDRAAGAISLQ